MQIGSTEFTNNVILAPMAGVTDLPFRNICRQLGAGAAVAEMLTAKQDLWHTSKSQFRQIHSSETGTRWIQIVGSEPEQLALAAQHCEHKGAHLIDINMGCPAKKVCRKAAGSALLKDEALVKAILIAVVESVALPVTLKIRTGWAKENKNALTIAKIAEDAGIQALSVHGRTRQCRYNVAAEYDTVAEIKQAVSIPIIVNGDINCAKKAKTVLDQTQADGIMVGRGALGNPWLFREVNHYLNFKEEISKPSADEIYQVIFSHVQALHNFYGSHLGLRIARKHVSWYEEKFADFLSLKYLFNRLETPEGQLSYISEMSSTNKTHAA